MRRFAALALFALLALPARAEAPLEAWYAALAEADAEAAALVLADDAVLVFEDLGVEQTKDEFLESFDEWSAAVAGAAILFAEEARTDDTVTARVCYRFEANELMTREVFTLAGGRIARSVQSPLGEACEGF